MEHPRCKSRGHLDFEVLLELVHQCLIYRDIPLYYLGAFNSKYFPTDPEGLLKSIYRFVRQQVTSLKDLRYLNFLEFFARNLQHLAVFTTNYDFCVERYASHIINVRCIEKTSNSSFGRSTSRKTPIINLYKLHGSANWVSSDSGDIEAIPLGGRSSTKLIDAAEIAEIDRIMLFPAQTKDIGKPHYAFLQKEYERHLLSLELLVIVGYSFYDDYMIDMLEMSCRQNEQLLLILIDPAATSIRNRIRAFSLDRFGHNMITRRIIALNAGVDLLNDNNYREQWLNIKNNIIHRNYEFYESIHMNGVVEYGGDPIYDIRMEYIAEAMRIHNNYSGIKGISILAFEEMSRDVSSDLIEEINECDYVASALHHLISNTWIRGRFLSGIETAAKTDMQVGRNRGRIVLDESYVKDSYRSNRIIGEGKTEYTTKIGEMCKKISHCINKEKAFWAKTAKVLNAFGDFCHYCSQAERAAERDSNGSGQVNEVYLRDIVNTWNDLQVALGKKLKQE